MAAAFPASEIVAAVAELADPARAASSARFFKTGPGDYGEGDVFVGVAVPPLRKVAKRFRGVQPSAIRELLDSPIHEHRLLALFLLRAEFERASAGTEQSAWVELYLTALHDGRVDNWDLIDSSADPILGEWLVSCADHEPLVELAGQDDLWCRRAGIVGTFAFLKHGFSDATIAVVSVVLDDRRDLIQKATGWMLRELGKRVDRTVLTDYLGAHAAQMGSTALRYATEHLDPGDRAYLRSLR
ncbi:DNA alkylation repair protein [Gordonia sp. DT101]|uniref:DNA alkylation repair protein n=1 Tax=Gordonia sp. DT101 TaxID=3416545 RepID=UPI003CEDEC61